MKKTLRKLGVVLLLFVLLFNIGCTSTNVENSKEVESNEISKEKVSKEKPKYVFMFVGDGLGASQRQISEYYKKSLNEDSTKLVMNSFDVAGIYTTHSDSTLVTDSAAAGTALATGVKTTNGIIGETTDGKKLKSLVEVAEENGMATGLVSTTRLTHATPAAFASHNESRDNESDIANDFLESGVDFFAGGGIRYFIPENYPKDTKDYTGATIKSKRKDDKDLIKEFEEKGYKTFIGNDGADSFSEYSFDKKEKVFSAFTYSHMPFEIDRKALSNELPSLSTMTDKAIDCLEEYEEGFFLMVEGGRIDHAAHGNDISAMIQDVLAFDKSINEAVEFYNEHPEETLIVVVGDHETGGLGLGMDKQGYFVDLEPLKEIKLSTNDQIVYGRNKYDGDREKYLNFIKKDIGLKNLTEGELAKIEKGMDQSDSGESYGYYGYDAAGMAVTHVISERANVFWTATVHTGTPIPLTAKGIGSEEFTICRDNTEIPNKIAEILKWELN